MYFMLFDRYEIHIQAFVDFINGKLIIFNPHLHKTILRNIYSKNINTHIFQNLMWICLSEHFENFVFF